MSELTADRANALAIYLVGISAMENRVRVRTRGDINTVRQALAKFGDMVVVEQSHE
jgi:hypothetical protein